MKAPTKLPASEKNTVNNTINTPIGYSISKKSRKQIYHENYIKNQERKKEQQRQRYIQKKEQAEKQVNKYSQASDFRVLMSLKEYSELNQEKRKTWLDFVWTLQSLLGENKHPRISNVVEIMRLRELAEILINDYWSIAKSEERKGRNWKSLSGEEKSKLIKYWAREKARREQAISEAVEELERKGEQYEKEIEIAKFHEERGKINCPCYDCEKKKETKAKIDKEFTEQEPKIEKGECCICGKFRKLDEEGSCKNCKNQLE